MTSDGTHSYTYDAEGNLTAVDGGTTANYVYNALNQRVETTNVGGTYEFLYDNDGRRISRWLTSNSGNEGNVYWGNQLLAFRASDSHTYFEHPDWLGATRVRTDYQGNVAESMASLPFGDGTSIGVNNSNAEAETAHFAMQDKDFYGASDSGTDHALFRQYMDTVGSWMSPDPYLGSYDPSNPQSMNRYSYVQNNPLGFVDPEGLLIQIDGGGYTDCGNDPNCTQANDNYGWTGGPLDGGDEIVYACIDSFDPLCQIGGLYSTGLYGGDFSLVAGVNGFVWINNYNGDELDAAAAAEDGLPTPDYSPTIGLGPANGYAPEGAGGANSGCVNKIIDKTNADTGLGKL